MTDNLRDRIAAALKAANDRVAGFIGYDEMADAVIAVMREANDDIRPALKEALASWDDDTDEQPTSHHMARRWPLPVRLPASQYRQH